MVPEGKVFPSVKICPRCSHNNAEIGFSGGDVLKIYCDDAFAYDELCLPSECLLP